MTLELLKGWGELLLLAPAIIAAWKLPRCLRWVKMKLTTMFASALMAQITPLLADMSRQIDQVHHQVFPNSGGSMNDKVTRVLESAHRTETSVNLLRGTMRAHQDADLTQARFEASSDGRFAWVSHAFLRWCNRGIEQVTGYGWINCIAHADRDRVREEWEAAIREEREFSAHFLMHMVGGEDFQVEAFAKPVRSGPPQDETQNWVGVITRARAA
jgi:PAS domain-containing protein